MGKVCVPVSKKVQRKLTTGEISLLASLRAEAKKDGIKSSQFTKWCEAINISRSRASLARDAMQVEALGVVGSVDKHTGRHKLLDPDQMEVAIGWVDDQFFLKQAVSIKSFAEKVEKLFGVKLSNSTAGQYLVDAGMAKRPGSEAVATRLSDKEEAKMISVYWKLCRAP